MNSETTHGTAVWLDRVDSILQNLLHFVLRLRRALASGVATRRRPKPLPGQCGHKDRAGQLSIYRDGRWETKAQQKMAAVLGAQINSRPALIVHMPGQKIDMIVDPLFGAGVASQRVTDLSDGISAVQAAPHAWSLLIVDIDDLGDLEETLDRLLALRLAAPQVPVILLSGYFSQCDFSEERLPLCDASLRAPSSAARLLEAVTAAIDNNRIWRARVIEMNNRPSLAHVPGSPGNSVRPVGRTRKPSSSTLSS